MAATSTGIGCPASQSQVPTCLNHFMKIQKCRDLCHVFSCSSTILYHNSTICHSISWYLMECKQVLHHVTCSFEFFFLMYLIHIYIYTYPYIYIYIYIIPSFYNPLSHRNQSSQRCHASLGSIPAPGTGKGAEGASSLAKPRAARQSSNLKRKVHLWQ